MSTIISTVDLHCAEGSSDKVYHVAIRDNGSLYDVIFAYGRRGAALNRGTKNTAPVTENKAHNICDKLVNEKLGKGYRHAPGISGNVFGSSPMSSAPAPASATVPPVMGRGILPQLLNAITEEDAMDYINDTRYCAQEKMNGRRLMVDSGKTVKPTNRKGLEVAPAPSILSAISDSDDGLYDGEDMGSSYYVFDILSHKGIDLRQEPYSKRYEILTRAAWAGASLKIVPTAYTSIEKRELWERVKRDKGEGVVFKLLSAPYSPGRPNSGGDQLKAKFWQSASCIVLGINEGKRSIQIGVVENGALANIGNCTIPFNHKIPTSGSVVEIRYLYAYYGGSLYQPQYEGERTDLYPSECTPSQLHYYQGNTELLELDEAA